jgi:biotin carboxylase
MKPRMLMVGGVDNVYAKARECGISLTVIQEKGRIGKADVDAVDCLITLSINDPIIVSLAELLHRAQPFHSTLSFQEHGLMNAALVRERLGIFGNPLRPVALTRDKGRMREHLSAAGFGSVPYILSNSAPEIESFGNTAGWPIILKPRSGTGSAQVHKVSSDSELNSALAHIFAIKPDTDLMAERFILGAEVSVEGLTWAGEHQILAVTDKLTTGPPHFVEIGHDMPSALPASQIGKISDLVMSFLDSIGHRYGPSHTEVIVSAEGPVIVESHTRTGGDQIFEMVEIVTGVDMFGAVLRGFAGTYPWPQPFGRPRGASIRFFNFKPGVVTGLAGIAEARRAPGVVRVDSNLAVGSAVAPIRDTRTRHGYVLAAGASRDAAIHAAETALSQVHIDTE